MEENDLAQFQESLLNHLSGQTEVDSILTRLSTEEFDPDLTDYLATFDPKMVAVAATLVKKWSRKTSVPDS